MLRFNRQRRPDSSSSFIPEVRDKRVIADICAAEAVRNRGYI
jgi:hypothetical protein